MPKSITQYNVLIGSPSGLNDERKRFRDVLNRCSETYGRNISVRFQPIGWEDTLNGVGRPQDLINKDLEQCDHAVFMLHDQWGSQTGNGFSSGTEEEFTLAEKLKQSGSVSNIAIFFKEVDPSKIKDPGDQLKPVIAFRKKLIEGKRHLFKDYTCVDEFADILDRHLAEWLAAHVTLTANITNASLATGTKPDNAEIVAPSFSYWLAEAIRCAEDTKNYSESIFCAVKALDLAKTDLEWAKAQNCWSVAQFHLRSIQVAVDGLDSIVDKFRSSRDRARHVWLAKALVNKGIILEVLKRSDDAIAVYDDVVGRFGAASEAALWEQVARALVNKGVTLGMLGRSEDEIAVYDDVVGRFGAASEAALREQVASALFNKGVTLGMLGRSDDAIAVYDDVVGRFGAASEAALWEQVASALFNKGVTLGMLGRSEDEIAVYDNVVGRFGAASEAALREKVASALFNKGVTLGMLGRSEDAIAVYDDVVGRFGAASEAALREKVASALFNKGVTLGMLGRSEDAIAVYDDVVGRFGAASEAALFKIVERAKAARAKMQTKPKRRSKK